MSAQGRGPDSNLVHMSPRELSGLQSLAMAHGGTLTINPETGLPEAGFLDSILPTLLGGAATFFSGGTITPLMAALGVGGLTALTSKDLGKGLMAGLGAYGGAGIAGGLMNFGEAAIGAEAARGALPAGVDKFGADAIGFEPAQMAAEKAARAGATNFDRLSRGVTEGFKNPMGAFSAIGNGSKLQGAAMIGAPLLSAISSQDATSVPTAEQIRFDPRYANINISRQQRPYQPDTGSSGERSYFGPTNVTQYGADGGFVSNDEIQHFAYGGGTIDPTYNYSGYGNRNVSSAMQPITSVEAPKPDFVGADGKTYRYDPIKKSWYVIKEAEEAKVNAGVETLIGDGSPAGGENAPNTTPIANNGLLSTILGRTTQTASPVESRTENTPQQTFRTGELRSQNADVNEVNTPQQTFRTGELNAQNAKNITDMNKQTHIDLTTEYERELQEADAANQAQRDAVTSANSPTATGGRANSPTATSGIASLGVNPNAGELSNRDPATTTLEGRLAANTAQASANAAASAGRAAALADVVQAAKDNADNPTGDTSAGNTGEGLGAAYDKANGGMVGRYAQGGLGSLGGYSDGGRLLRGPGDGVSDNIPATIGRGRQPARLADGEFVVPARIVSELGNGSTEAGARALYKMMDRIQANRRKTTGKNRVAVNSKSHKYLPA